jgi:ABC-type transport system involved in multi-copper enzyme maturation permease subunit
MSDPANVERRPRFEWPSLGPLFYYDLVASTRRGQHALLRALTAVVLLITILVTYSYCVRGFDPFQPFAPLPAMRANDAAHFASWFVAACFFVQLTGLFLLTPTIMGDTIAREKENRTLEYMFMTELTDWEIVIGKLGSRLAYLVGVLLTAMPILALTQLFGGVSMEQLVFGYATLLSSLFAVGSMSLYCSVVGKTALSATIAAYAATLAYSTFAFCCLTGGLAVGSHWLGTYVGVAVNIVIGSLALSFSVRDLRPRARRVGPYIPHIVPEVRKAPEYKSLPHVELKPLGGSTRTAPDQRVARQPVRPHPRPESWILRRLPPIDDRRPLLWKELCQPAADRRIRQSRNVLALALLAPMVLMCTPASMFLFEPLIRVSDLVDVARATLGILIVLLSGLLSLVVLQHSATSVTREREKSTLAGLFTLPVERAEILEAKWLAGFVGWWPVLAVLFALVLVSVIFNGWTAIIRAGVLIVAIAAPLQFVASLGIWLSVINRSSLRANLAAVLLLMLVAAGPLIVANYIEMAAPFYGRYGLQVDEWIATAFMPPRAWYLTVAGADGGSAQHLQAVAWGALAYAVGAWILWRDACRRFRRISG